MAKKQALIIGENIIVPEKTQVRRVIHDWSNNSYTIELSVINDKGAYNYTIEDVNFEQQPTQDEVINYVNNHIEENKQQVDFDNL